MKVYEVYLFEYEGSSRLFFVRDDDTNFENDVKTAIINVVRTILSGENEDYFYLFYDNYDKSAYISLLNDSVAERIFIIEMKKLGYKLIEADEKISLRGDINLVGKYVDMADDITKEVIEYLSTNEEIQEIKRNFENKTRELWEAEHESD